MTVIVATEGDSEILALPEILKKVRPARQPWSSKVLKVSCQPDGPPKHVARATQASLKIAMAKNASQFVLVLDRERRRESPELLVRDVLQAIAEIGAWPFPIHVVYKDRTFENWLIADLGALRAQSARFRVTAALEREVEPGRADLVDAKALFDKATVGRSYDKKVDGLNIAKRLDVDAAGRHSRSFRHFLHVLRHDTYVHQCKRPVN